VLVDWKEKRYVIERSSNPVKNKIREKGSMSL
jgi:hypothetical protein